MVDLMNSGEAMKVASQILMSGMDRESADRMKREQSGVVVIGTVKGDQHDIGKNLVALLLINYLKDSGLRDAFKVIVGGGTTSEAWAHEIGADGWAVDALAKKIRG